ncbi:MAG TPA: hypothetical protein VJ964_17600 [Balneolaceae bacterium]|nr:hypothetical protein [Balneolaceae bacterium]
MIENYEQRKEQLELALKGYFSLIPEIDENEYYCTFRKHWNELASELARAELSDAKQSIHIITMGATQRKEDLFKTAYSFYQRVEMNLREIFKVLNSCIRDDSQDFERYHRLINTETKMKTGCHGSVLKDLKEIWETHGFQDYSFIGTDKNVHEYIKDQLDYTARLIKRTGFQFAKFLGLDRALDHLNHEDQLPYYDVKPMLDISQNAFCYSSIADCTLDSLFNWGHSVKDSMSIRFLNLTMMNKLSHEDAYEQIRNELIQFGFYDEEAFPDEPKIIADRARRLRDKRWEELRALSA